MFRWVRSLHGGLGVALALGTLLYAVSGWILVHADATDADVPAASEERVVALETLAHAEDTATCAALTERVGHELGLTGRTRVFGEPDLGCSWTFARAGSSVRVDGAPGTATAAVSRRASGWAGTLSALHSISGPNGGTAFVLWAVLVDALALAMIGFAASGVWLWWLRGQQRRSGAVVLALSTGLTVAWIAALLFG